MFYQFSDKCCYHWVVVERLDVQCVEVVGEHALHQRPSTSLHVKLVQSWPEGPVGHQRQQIVEEDHPKNGRIEAEVDVQRKTEVVEAALGAFQVAQCRVGKQETAEIS